MEKLNSIEKLCDYEQFENSINYHFSDKSLLLQAMTHGSSSRYKLTDDYQILEFLGDFVLNFLISRQLEKQSRDMAITPGDMSQRRSILISNNVLAWIAVRNNFHQYLRIECPSAKSEVDRIINQVDETEPKIHVLRENDKEEKRNIVTVVSQEAPKVLADIFESVAGAIYPDSGDQIEIVWKIYVPLLKEAFDIF